MGLITRFDNQSGGVCLNSLAGLTAASWETLLRPFTLFNLGSGQLTNLREHPNIVWGNSQFAGHAPLNRSWNEHRHGKLNVNVGHFQDGKHVCFPNHYMSACLGCQGVLGMFVSLSNYSSIWYCLHLFVEHVCLHHWRNIKHHDSIECIQPFSHKSMDDFSA